MPSLLVTNDFPPKVGGIQSYLWELWRRLPADQVTVLTTPYDGAADFDRAQPFRVVRDPDKVLLPTPALARRIDALAREVCADVIFLDPALPLGVLGPRLRSAPYIAVLHGAEVTVPGRLPGSRALLRRVLEGAAGVLAAGTYPAAEAARAAGRPLPGLVIPPGVDIERFNPAQADSAARALTRKRFGLPESAPVVLGLSRLVPRKGFDVLIDAVARLDRHRFPAPAGPPAPSPVAASPSAVSPSGAGGASVSGPSVGDRRSGAVGASVSGPSVGDGRSGAVGASGSGPPVGDWRSGAADQSGAAGPARTGQPSDAGEPVHLAIAGGGRDRERLARRAARAGLGERFHLLGRVPDEDLAAVYGAADVFAMCCRERWGGLEAEGFGIVFLEAAACGVPAVAGRSGGAWEAVEDGETGFVVDPLDAGAVAGALHRLLADPTLRQAMGVAARQRAEAGFAYDILAARLAPLAGGDLSGLTPVGTPGPCPGAAAPGPGSAKPGHGSGNVAPGHGSAAAAPGSAAAAPGSASVAPGSGAAAPGSASAGPGSASAGPGSASAGPGPRARTGTPES